MKTKKSLFARVILFAMSALFAITTQSCETDIPFEDPTPPEFLFRITGDGFEYNFTQDSDFDNLRLNLNENATYEFTLIGSDAGGVAKIQWTTQPADYITRHTGTPSPWTYSDFGSLTEWWGNPGNPLTGAVLTGSFSPSEQINDWAVFRFSVTDFGGAGRSPNTIVMELFMFIAIQPTELIEL